MIILITLVKRQGFDKKVHTLCLQGLEALFEVLFRSPKLGRS